MGFKMSFCQACPSRLDRFTDNREGTGDFFVCNHVTSSTFLLLRLRRAVEGIWLTVRLQRFFYGEPRLTHDIDLVLSLQKTEYVIVRKLQYFKEGGSQKPLSDIRKMMNSPECVIDIMRLERWVKFKNVHKEWSLARKYNE